VITEVAIKQRGFDVLALSGAFTMQQSVPDRSSGVCAGKEWIRTVGADF
jgi:hypothetical protein